VFIVSVIVWSNCHILQFLHQPAEAGDVTEWGKLSRRFTDLDLDLAPLVIVVAGCVVQQQGGHIEHLM